MTNIEEILELVKERLRISYQNGVLDQKQGTVALSNNFEAHVTEGVRDIKQELTALEESKNQAYYERNQLVLALSKLYESWMELHPLEDESWEKDWRHIVFINIPTPGGNFQGHRLKNNKQLSWHIHDSEVKYFSHLELRNGNSWDGHTTKEKYDRLLELRPDSFYG